MPRRPRIVLADVPLHVIQRGNNRQLCFLTDADRRFYLDCLAAYGSENGCAVHAYVLMSNHVHLLLTPRSAGGVGALMKRLGQRYTQYFNRTHSRSGSLWEGRFRSSPIQDEAYALACYRYIERNPVRAGMVADPGDYRWSSYHANARGVADEVVVPHPLYLALGRDAKARRAAYRAFLGEAPAPEFVEGLRRATNGNFVLGDAGFQARAEAALGYRVTPGKAGRPRRGGQRQSVGPLERPDKNVV